MPSRINYKTGKRVKSFIFIFHNIRVTDVSSGDLQNEKGVAIPLEKLEGQLNQLKVIFAEKQELVSALEEYGSAARGGGPSDGTAAEPAEPAEPCRTLPYP